MVTINNEELRETFNHLLTIENILTKEVRQIKGNKSYIDKIVPDHLMKVYSQKDRNAVIFADKLTQTAYENAILTLVATFERITFAKYKTTYGTIKTLVIDNAVKPLAYYKARENFVYGNLDKLSGLIKLIEGHLSTDLAQKLNTIKHHRNYIAHGKNTEPPISEMKLDDIAKTLDEVIREIES